MAKKTWNEKLTTSNPKTAEIQQAPLEMAIRFGGPRMLIAPPMEYNEIMKNVPVGQIITIDKIRKQLAQKHDADWTCPITAGIFINICANAAVERLDKNFPWWRTVKANGELCEKFPGGCEAQKVLLEGEGHTVTWRGKRCFVV